MPDSIIILFLDKITSTQLWHLDTLAKRLNDLPRQKCLISGSELFMHPQWLGAEVCSIHTWLEMFLQDRCAQLPAREVFDGVSRNAHACVRLATEYTRGAQIFG
jgi:hypothetical protein